MVHPERVPLVDEGARQVVGVDLAALVVEVLEDLLEDDAALDVDVEKRGLRQDLAEQDGWRRPSDSGGKDSEKMPWSTCVDAKSEPPRRSNARLTSWALRTRRVPR